MKKYYCFRPDTCGCELHYEYDSSIGPNHDTDLITNDIYTDPNGQQRQTIKCLAHQAIADMVTLKNTVHLGENVRKNKFIDAAMKLYPTSFPIATTADGQTIDYSKLSWNYDTQRVLNVTIAGLTKPQKNSLQSTADTEFGVGKVKVI